MLTNKKYSGKIPLVVGAAVAAAVLMALLPLSGCDTNSGSGGNTTTQQAGTGTGGTGGNTGAGGTSGGGTSTGGGTTGTGTGDNVGTGQNPPATPATYTVTFNANGGSAVASQTVESGKAATRPATDPTLEGSWFLGWYGDSALTTEYDFAAPVTADTTVYAKWSYRLHATPTRLTDYTSPNHTGSEWTYVAFGDWPQTVMASGVTVEDEAKSKTMGGLIYCLGSDGNHYVKQGDSYYKVEPIVWRVLTSDYNSTGTALLLAESVLTGGIPYYVDTAQRTIGGQTVYANNYQYSTVRAWLNGLDVVKGDTEKDSAYADKGFLQSAFTAAAQALIAATSVDNSAASTNPANNPTQWNSGTNDYACANTSDKVFLLSEKEATTTGYGFAAYNQYGQGNTRIRVTTDYAKATGAYQDSTDGYGSSWLLRSPRLYNGLVALCVESSGWAPGTAANVELTDYGVVPALCVQLQ